MEQLSINGIPLYVRVDDSLEPGEYILIGASPKPDMIQVVSSEDPQTLLEFEVHCVELYDGEGPDAKAIGFQIEISNPVSGEKVCQQVIF